MSDRRYSWVTKTPAPVGLQMVTFGNVVLKTQGAGLRLGHRKAL